jgi:guanidinobutyrase / D-arginase
MHWKYYKKALAAYFAFANAVSVQGQLQQAFMLPGDGGQILSVWGVNCVGTQADSVFSGIATFGRIPYRECFGRDKHEKFDIAILGAPFDTGTSYRYSSAWESK